MGLLRCYCNNRRVVSSSGEGNVKCAGVAAKVWVVVVTLGLAVCSDLVAGVEGGLPLVKQCDEIECNELEYCSIIDHQCHPCKDICDPESNNYQANTCESSCQDYIHDSRYHRLGNTSLFELEDKYKSLEGDVKVLKIAVGICVAVIVIVVACLVAFLVYFYKLMHPPQVGSPGEKKKPLANKPSVNNVELPTIYNNRYGVTTPTPENSPSSVVSSSPVDTNVSAVTGSTTVPPYNHTPSLPNGIHRASPTKSDSSIATPATASTLMSASVSSQLVNGGVATCHAAGVRSGNSNPKTNRFRREPSESTLPDNCAYDNLSMSPQHMPYSHHV